MKPLYLEATECTPKILCDHDRHLLEIRGSSYLENTLEFYEPILIWFKEYLIQPEIRHITVNIELVYFNSSSSRILMEVFEMLNDRAFNEETAIDVYWFYEPEDEDMLEFGEEFQQDYRAIVFHFVEHSSEEI